MRRREVQRWLAAAGAALGEQLYSHHLGRIVLDEEEAPRTLLRDCARQAGRCARYLEQGARRRGEDERVLEERRIRALCLFARRLAREVEL